MIAAILIISGSTILTSCSSEDDLVRPPTDEVEAQLQKMTLREKVGQLFYVRPECLDTTIHFNQPGGHAAGSRCPSSRTGARGLGALLCPPPSPRPRRVITERPASVCAVLQTPGFSDCNPMDCSTPGLPVHHQLLEFTQTHVH